MTTKRIRGKIEKKTGKMPKKRTVTNSNNNQAIIFESTVGVPCIKGLL